MASFRRPSARISSKATVGVASAIAVVANESRNELILSPHATVDVWLKLRTATGVNSPDPVAVIGEGILLKAGTPPFRITSYTGPVAAIAGTAATDIQVTDI